MPLSLLGQDHDRRPEEIRKEQAGEGEGCWPNDFIVSSHPGQTIDNRL